MELPQPRRQGLLGKKKKNLENQPQFCQSRSAVCETGATLGRQLAPAFYSHSLGATVKRRAQRHMHEQTDTSGELLTYSPNHFIDLWTKDVKAY